MKINIKLDNDFATQLKKLKENYGEDFLKLNGLDVHKPACNDGRCCVAHKKCMS